MRCAVLPLLLCALVPPTCTDPQGPALAGAAPQPPGGPPTPAQLQAAKDAFAKVGGVYAGVWDPATKRTVAVFAMPGSTKDMDLRELPDLPFGFGLSLRDTQVTDAGLKELRGLK